ncbi:hypothetical protein LOK49_LG14G01327 [Camellia lanceoleosa]|uniref:Uncharacterized protein n=1 Tax=Camellia lanceoleosa TaxID=1840588 RepID=A0ACC0FD30_9ERIC|nr:hypothetical protein LOK49_LG14G01327 [Camellia lanceoleosa]
MLLEPDGTTQCDPNNHKFLVLNHMLWDAMAVVLDLSASGAAKSPYMKIRNKFGLLSNHWMVQNPNPR